jgi:4-hydroxyphenylpyruvate dioxygenase-like putative hemolysin
VRTLAAADKARIGSELSGTGQFVQFDAEVQSLMDKAFPATELQASHPDGDLAMKPRYLSIDHIAIAVRDLDEAIGYYCEVLGFSLKQRRTIVGKTTGMLSAEIEHNGICLVLCQGTEPQSQVSRLIENYGPGIAHVAFQVEDVGAISKDLKERGLKFDTSLIQGPGLSQIFSSRDANSGFSFEFIERSGEGNFIQANVEELFNQLESSGKY